MTHLHKNFGFLAFALSSLLAGCGGGDDVDPMNNGGSGGTPAGSGGTPSGGSGGTTGGTGGTAAGSGGTGALGVECPAPAAALLTDFTLAEDATDTTTLTFGDFTNTFSGGTFHYPTDGMYPLTSDMTTGAWELAGDVGDYSGFGIYFAACHSLDASLYKGISFTISGSVPSSGTSTTEPAETVTLSIGTAANTITADWLNAYKLNAADADVVGLGRCTPMPGASPNDRYNGSCSSPRFSVPVTASPTTVTVLWADFTGGRPETMLNPAEITSIAWNFPPPAGAGTETPTPYPLSLTIDDLSFVE